MHILGIETSCDETAAAVVKNGRDILSNVVASSLKEHKKYGGIIPEIASRRQMELITLVVKEALSKAGMDLKDIRAVAVTRSPGLIGSLLVGTCFARSLAYALRRPLIEVDHIKAHLHANFLKDTGKDTSQPRNRPKLPAAGLVVSGGHTSLFYVKDPLNFRLVGQTRDDAAGEAFDKVARILDLGYPGGPVIDRLAKKGRPGKVRFPCADLKGSRDFSFSGIKTAVLYYARDKWDRRSVTIHDLAYAFQDSVVSVLTRKCIRLCEAVKTRTLLVGGGVAANSMLRERLLLETRARGIRLFVPPMALCTDNAAMIAAAGYPFFQKRFGGKGRHS